MNENLVRFAEHSVKLREFSQNSREKLQKLELLVENFPVCTAKDLSFQGNKRFAFDCEDDQLFLNFEIKGEKQFLSPVLLHFPINEEEVGYDLSFMQYKDTNSLIINRVLVIKIYKFHDLKGLQLKYLSFRVEVLNLWNF